MEITRQKLLDTAGEVFAEKGFQATTIREICARAGTNLAAVNYHFGDKQKLYVEAVYAAYCGVNEPAEFPAGTPAEVKLLEFIRLMMADMLNTDSPSWHIELMMREMARPTAACEELVRNYIGPKFDMLMGILDELLPAKMELRARRLFGFSICGQCLLYRFHRPIGRLLIGEEEFEALFDVDCLAGHIFRFSVGGIARAHDIQRQESHT